MNIVQQDLKLSFTGYILTNVPVEYKRSQLEQSIIDEKARKLIRKKGNDNNICSGGRFLLKYFIRFKKDGLYRTILNLKKLN